MIMDVKSQFASFYFSIITNNLSQQIYVLQDLESKY